MAQFLKRIKEKVQKNKKTEKEDFSFDFSQPKEPQVDKDGMTPAQRTRHQELVDKIRQTHIIPEEFEGLTKKKAKEDLEKRISEKLNLQIDEDDMLAKIHAEKERQREELALQGERRRKRREQKKAEQKKMQPVLMEDAVIAVYEEPKENLVEPEELIEENKGIEETPEKEAQIEGQITILDINTRIQKEKEEEERKALPDLTETTYTEVIKGEDLVGEKLFAVIIKTAKHCSRWTKDFFTTQFRKIFSKKPEKEKELKNKRQRFLEKIQEIKDKIIGYEQKAAASMVGFVDRLDDRNDILAEKAEEAAFRGEVKVHRTRAWMDKNKKKLIFSFAGLVFFGLVVVLTINYMSAYEYSYNGKTLGRVKSQEDVIKILEIVSEQLTKQHNAEIFIDKEEDIAFKKVWNFGNDIDDTEDVLRRLTYMQDMSVKGYGIYVEDKWIATLESEKLAKEVLEAVMNMYAPQSEAVQYEDIDFAENIEILQVDTKLGLLSSFEDVLYKILTGAEEQKVHIVNSGDTFSGIAKQYGISQADLQASNPTVSPERLSIGQEIVLTQAVPLLTVQTVEISTYVEYLPYDTIYEDNANIYIGETSTKKRGEDGERTVTAKIVRNNGMEVAKLELQSSITKDPVTAIVYKGTKELPPKKGTGTFAYPVQSYTLTSKFGSRWGRMHYGIDLAAPTGTKIRASDGGTVIQSGYQGSYGYVVKIDHGGGFVTVYAHCSKLYVKVGEQVYKGQHIANVGNTGRSTGPHCHFEIQYLGVQKNPLNYL